VNFQRRQRKKLSQLPCWFFYVCNSIDFLK
jgi:hypothetical protein